MKHTPEEAVSFIHKLRRGTTSSSSSAALFPAVFLCQAAVLLFPPPAAAAVEGRISRIGLFSGGDPVVRVGNWTLIEAELRWTGARPFVGTMQTRQTDRDGDVVVYEAPVALEPDADWRPFHLYFVPSDPSMRSEIRVGIYDEEGALVRVKGESGEPSDFLLAAQPQYISPDEMLIVDLTNPSPLPHLVVLDRLRRNQLGYVNARCVRSMPPRDLPSRRQGLDGVDVVVWDDADPSALAAAQVEALADWVSHGGRLLLTSGRNWRMLAPSALSHLLPVRIEGAEERTEAQEFLDIVDNVRYAGRLDRHYARNPFLRCNMTLLPDALPLPDQCPNPQICHRRIVGRGLVVFLGASLEDLIPVPRDIRRIARRDDQMVDSSDEDDLFLSIGCERVLARRLLALPPTVEPSQGLNPFGAMDLFEVIRGSIAFESVGAKFLVFAILFATSYTFLATVGSYVFLKKRSSLHHCWTVFGAVSLAGSIIGTAMVGTLRGVTKSLWQTTVVDARAGSDVAYAAGFFGVKTPNHTRLDVALPIGEPGLGRDRAYGPVQPFPGADQQLSSDTHFAASAQYASQFGGEQLVDVPVRATLKEFAGTWSGHLPGRLEGRIVLRRPVDADNPLRYEFAPGSSLRNTLGTDLKDCFLMITAEEVAGERATPLANCFVLGDLPARGAGSELSDFDLRVRLLHNPEEGIPAGDARTRISSLPLLSSQIDLWKGQLRSVLPALGNADQRGLRPSATDEYASILLLSFFDQMRTEESDRTILRRGQGRRLGCSHLLTRRTAILIGRSSDPPPAILDVEGRSLAPSRSISVYRFVIPVDRTWR